MAQASLANLRRKKEKVFENKNGQRETSVENELRLINSCNDCGRSPT